MAVGIAIGTAVAATTTGSAAMAGDRDSRGGSRPTTVREQLSGFEETPLALSTTGTGQFRATINEQEQTITYSLSYSSLEGAVTQAHIHVGAVAQTGGISIFLCSNLGNGPAGTQACPAAPATVTGTLQAGDVIGPSGQGITAGQFDEVVRAFRAGATYVNVHSTLYPVGEIRAQLGHHH
jgi:hypothetical protein